VIDFGVSGERTALAWQRTSLSLVALSAATARLAWSTLGVGVVVPAVATGALGAWVFAVSGRYTVGDADHDAVEQMPNGRLALAVALAAVVLATSEFVALLAG
jgi:uncharacterized membrane protein YidH (DUF202 family)